MTTYKVVSIDDALEMMARMDAEVESGRPSDQELFGTTESALRLSASEESRSKNGWDASKLSSY